MDNPEKLSKLDQQIVELVSEHWENNQRPLLLSQLGTHGDGKIASATKKHAGNLSSYLRGRLANEVSVLQHSSIKAMIGVVPSSITISDDSVDALFVPATKVASGVYHFAFLFAFQKPLQNSKRRFICSTGSPRFFDLEQDKELGEGFIEITPKYITNSNSDDVGAREMAEKWIADNKLQADRFHWSKKTISVEFPDNDLLSRLLQSIGTEDLRRVSLPLDIVHKLRSKRI
ncbi:MAG: hypothetical protein OXI87_11345 [Albidovulum sp.]|nr:hypothetical protein [Albidovulum sp.]MDE0305455.1 hypothetical protein [Albidovulum sp.]MDE0532628.1 hypothetical protein [Albidovulum sp.]